jgi:hypothetical protein
MPRYVGYHEVGYRLRSSLQHEVTRSNRRRLQPTTRYASPDMGLRIAKGCPPHALLINTPLLAQRIDNNALTL